MTEKDQYKEKKSHLLLRIIWGLIPWILVAGAVWAVVNMAGEIKAEQARLTKEKKEAIKQQAPATRVVLLNLHAKTIKDRIQLPAEVEANEVLLVRAEVTGQVVSLPVKEGQLVKRGQVLAQLDTRDYTARLEQIKANFTYTQNEYKRQSTLAKRQVTARSNLENIEAKLKDLEAQYRAAKTALERTTIRAPVSGRLNRLITKRGAFLNPMGEVAEILQIGEVKITVGVPESDVAAVINLKEADIVIDALNKRKVVGRKIYLSRQPATLARLYNMELAVKNTDGHILPGMFARVELVKKVIHNAVVMPLYAAISQNDRQYVFVAKGEVAHKREVKLGIMDGWQVQVAEGLSPGEKLVVVGHRELEDGQRINPIKTVDDVKEIFGQ